MHNFKVSPKVLPMLAFLTLILVFFGNGPVQDVQKSVSKPMVRKAVADSMGLQRYQVKQRELMLAVKSYFDAAIASGKIVGAGVSIVKGDSILVSEGFGRKNAKRPDKVDQETIFRLGSLSKGFAGVLAASLKNDVLLDWNDRISDYVPKFQLGDIENTQKITLANILSHTSGTPYHSFTNLVEAGLSPKDIASRFKTVVPISKPGTIYSYQNAIFALCGEVVGQKTGQDLKSVFTERLFRPLGMHTVNMDHLTLVASQNRAISHSNTSKGWEPQKLKDNYYNAIAAGGINASALDMAKWMRFLLGHNPEVLEESALNEAFTPFIEVKGHSKYYQRWPGHLKSYYGFGWRIHEYVDRFTRETKTMVHHGGSVNDFRNEIALFPDEDFGICVLLNSHSKMASRVIPDVQAIFQKVYHQDDPVQKIDPINS